MSDREISTLVTEAQRGDRDAFRRLYELFVRKIYNFLYRMVGSVEEAEDLAQQTFLMALQQLGTLRDPTQIESWIYRIARNEVYQKFRKKQPDSLEESGVEVQNIPEDRSHANPEAIMLDHELETTVQRALAQLPAKLREVFILGVVQGLSYADVAAIVGRSMLAVKTDVYRARLQIRDALRERFAGTKLLDQIG
jgi:RNA polymerase sigma-70 factor, ECF subfamily